MVDRLARTDQVTSHDVIIVVVVGQPNTRFVRTRRHRRVDDASLVVCMIVCLVIVDRAHAIDSFVFLCLCVLTKTRNAKLRTDFLLLHEWPGSPVTQGRVTGLQVAVTPPWGEGTGSWCVQATQTKAYRFTATFSMRIVNRDFYLKCFLDGLENKG